MFLSFVLMFLSFGDFARKRSNVYVTAPQIRGTILCEKADRILEITNILLRETE